MNEIVFIVWNHCSQISHNKGLYKDRSQHLSYRNILGTLMAAYFLHFELNSMNLKLSVHKLHEVAIQNQLFRELSVFKFKQYGLIEL